VATVIGIVMNGMSIDPIRALFWSAVINGVVAVPVMVVVMLLSVRKDVMGSFTLPLPLRVLGWLATLVMTAAAAVMVFSWII